MLNKRGLLFVLSAPSGTGKTVLIDGLVKSSPNIVRSISYTTRGIREGEKEGVDYFFVNEKEFNTLKEEGAFLESVTLFHASYGTSKVFIENLLAQGKHVILVIDTQGALELKEKYQVPTIFLMPPSLEELERRLLNRGTDSQKSRQERMAQASLEIALSKNYDYIVVNDDLEEATRVVKAIIVAEEHKLRSS